MSNSLSSILVWKMFSWYTFTSIIWYPFWVSSVRKFWIELMSWSM